MIQHTRVGSFDLLDCDCRVEGGYWDISTIELNVNVFLPWGRRGGRGLTVPSPFVYGFNPSWSEYPLSGLCRLEPLLIPYGPNLAPTYQHILHVPRGY